MTLATRTSLFFLAALAVVLVGLSTAIYGLARFHLLHQLTGRSTAAIDSLTASVEFVRAGLEWEPNQRLFVFSQGSDEGRLLWGVFDDRCKLIEGSFDPNPPTVDQLRAVEVVAGQPFDFNWQGNSWRIATRWVRPDSQSEIARSAVEKADETPDHPTYPALFLAAGVPVEPALAVLRNLMLFLAGLSLAIWLLAAWAGRWLCGKALKPVVEMAQTARTISAADLSQRLPPAGTGDELDALGRAFNELLTRLQDSFERQQRFTAEASHQMRTPLTAMIGQIEVALRRDRASEEYRKALESAQQQAAHLRQIVEMLLFICREDADAKVPKPDRLELDIWLAEHLQTWHQHPRSADLQFESGAEGLCWVGAQSALLAEAVNNLLDNACKYSPPGSPIQLSVESTGETVVLSVADHGYGIDIDEIPLVFDPFFRSADARRRG
ncbi:MAG TPA: histidine kinase dimerization/phospho-acceptor domain-containing protein, partial [Pirellulales bacterium]